MLKTPLVSQSVMGPCKASAAVGSVQYRSTAVLSSDKERKYGVGAAVGETEGVAVRVAEGVVEGVAEGVEEGEKVGDVEGVAVGAAVKTAENQNQKENTRQIEKKKLDVEAPATNVFSCWHHTAQHKTTPHTSTERNVSCDAILQTTHDARTCLEQLQPAPNLLQASQRCVENEL